MRGRATTRLRAVLVDSVARGVCMALQDLNFADEEAGRLDHFKRLANFRIYLVCLHARYSNIPARMRNKQTGKGGQRV